MQAVLRNTVCGTSTDLLLDQKLVKEHRVHVALVSQIRLLQEQHVGPSKDIRNLNTSAAIPIQFKTDGTAE